MPVQTEKLIVLTVKVLSTLSGALFLAGVAVKSVATVELAEVVRYATLARPSIAWILILLVIAFEFASGMSLLVGWHRRRAAVVGCVLSAGYVVLLLLAEFRGIEIDCRCLGPFSSMMTNRGEVILNIVAFDLCLVLGLLTRAEESARKASSIKDHAVAVSLLVGIVVLQLGAIEPVLRLDAKERYQQYLPIFHHLYTSDSVQAYEAGKGNKFVLLINYPDLSCPPCFDDLMNLSLQLASRGHASGGRRVIAVFRQDPLADPHRPERLRLWAKAHNVLFPVVVGSDSLFESVGFEKTSGILFDPNGKVLFAATFPMGHDKHERILRMMEVP